MSGEFATPAVTPEMFIVLAGLTVEREKRGTAWCEKFGVGPRRFLLGRVSPHNVIDLPPSRNPQILEYVKAQRAAQAILLAHCRACKGCPLGRD